MSGFIGGGGASTAAEERALYYNVMDSTGTEAGKAVVGFWPFDGDATDYSGANDLTANGSVAYSTSGLLSFADVEASGSDQYFAKADGAWDNSLVTGFTTWAVINLESVGVAQTIVAKQYKDTGTLANSLEGFAFQIDSSNRLVGHVFDNSVSVAGTRTYIGRRTTTGLSVSTWYYVAMRYLDSAGDSTDVKLEAYKLSDMTTFSDTTNSEANAGSFVNMEDINTPFEVGRQNGATPAGYYDGKTHVGITARELLDNDLAGEAQLYKEMLNL